MSDGITLAFTGELLGRGEYDGVAIDVVRSTEERRPDGPAMNALLAVERRDGGAVVGRYISWIGLYDIDCAIQYEPSRWRTVEPATAYRSEIVFDPFRRARGTFV